MLKLRTTDKKILLASGIFALVAMILLATFLWRISSAQARERENLLTHFGGEIVEVCIAKRDIKPGELLVAALIETERRSAVLLPKDAIIARDINKILDKRVSSLIVKGEPLLERRVLEMRHALDVLADGLSAVTIQTDPVRALGGEIEKGMRITVLGTDAHSVVHVLAIDVEVISSNTVKKKNDETSSLMGGSSSTEIAWVTLAVPDEHIAGVVAASASNTVYLVMPENPKALGSVGAVQSRDMIKAEGSHDITATVQSGGSR